MALDRLPARDLPPQRTLFLSDLHLGALSARGDLVLRFLQAHPADCYVLVGDILDLWRPLLPHWTAQDQAVIDHLQARAAAGARLIYIRGNHDPDPALIPAHARLDATYAAVHVHQTSQGQRFLVVHGDEADSRLIRTHLMTRLGSLIDYLLRRCDGLLQRLSRRQPQARGLFAHLIGWSNMLRYRGRRHEEAMVALARGRGLDGVICGHFHIAALHDHFGLTYANAGDWVDSMTALEDRGDGRLRLLGARAKGVDLPAVPPLGAGSSMTDQQKAMTR